ncbi:MAG: hypothetical protein QNK49_05705, partial [Porticoccus sp.]
MLFDDQRTKHSNYKINNKEPIGLSGKGWGIGGLSIDIHLAPDSQFFNSAGTDTSAFYQLTNL